MLAVNGSICCRLGAGKFALQSGDLAVLLRALLALRAKFTAEPIWLREVGRESLPVGALPLRLRRPDAGPTDPASALRAVLRTRLSGATASSSASANGSESWEPGVGRATP